VGYASGAFDMFHFGHLNLLRRARMLCDFLLVGVVTDEVYEQMRGVAPIIPFAERLTIVRNVRFVDCAIGEDTSDRRKSWELHRFDSLIKGDDWREKPGSAQLLGRLAEVGIPVQFVAYTQHTSSSRLRGVVERLEAERSAGAAGGTTRTEQPGAGLSVVHHRT
jgi:glycerol-3-phosphate cytidylyltransferase